MWTTTLRRSQMADALLQRGWLNNYSCPLCSQNLETPLHLPVEFPWSCLVWTTLATRMVIPSLSPAAWDDITSMNGFERAGMAAQRLKGRGLIHFSSERMGNLEGAEQTYFQCSGAFGA